MTVTDSVILGQDILSYADKRMSPMNAPVLSQRRGASIHLQRKNSELRYKQFMILKSKEQ